MSMCNIHVTCHVVPNCHVTCAMCHIMCRNMSFNVACNNACNIHGLYFCLVHFLWNDEAMKHQIFSFFFSTFVKNLTWIMPKREINQLYCFKLLWQSFVQVMEKSWLCYCQVMAKSWLSHGQLMASHGKICQSHSCHLKPNLWLGRKKSWQVMAKSWPSQMV